MWMQQASGTQRNKWIKATLGKQSEKALAVLLSTTMARRRHMEKIIWSQKMPIRREREGGKGHEFDGEVGVYLDVGGSGGMEVALP